MPLERERTDITGRMPLERERTGEDGELEARGEKAELMLLEGDVLI